MNEPKKTYLMQRCSDDVLKELWVRISDFGPMRARDPREVYEAFRNSDSTMKEWHKTRVVHYTLSNQAEELTDRALSSMIVGAAHRARIYDAFLELLVKIENLQLRLDE